ncbi:hypothetical protein [Nocardia sp. NPDC058705]|uniref:hypothetical protein n=1 Tax=Nocardia sp. NPDC058705 TaxID=3346609 RepID=UPI0036899C13
MRSAIIPVAFVLALIAGCSSNGVDHTEQTAAVTSGPVTAPDATPTSPLGSSIKIQSTGYAVGITEYTVASPRQEADVLKLDVTMHTLQGQNVPGTFFVLTADGLKVEGADPTAGQGSVGPLLAGTMIEGEKRTGTLAFAVPANAKLDKVVLYQGTINPPKAFWTGD